MHFCFVMMNIIVLKITLYRALLKDLSSLLTAILLTEYGVEEKRRGLFAIFTLNN